MPQIAFRTSRLKWHPKSPIGSGYAWHANFPSSRLLSLSLPRSLFRRWLRASRWRLTIDKFDGLADLLFSHVMDMNVDFGVNWEKERREPLSLLGGSRMLFLRFSHLLGHFAARPADSGAKFGHGRDSNNQKCLQGDPGSYPIRCIHNTKIGNPPGIGYRLPQFFYKFLRTELR